MSQWLVELQSKKPKAIIIVCGDFNVTEKPIEHLYEVSKDEVTFRRKHLTDFRQSRTDWVLVSHRIESESNCIWNDLSDHALISSTLLIPNERAKASHILLPNKPLIQEINNEAERQSTDLRSFMIVRGNIGMRRNRISRKIRLTLKTKIVVKHSLF